MSLASSLRSLAATLFRRSGMERQMEEELSIHTQSRADDLEKSGLTREEAERKAILAALSRSNGNVVRAAELLGVSRPTLYDLMHKFGLKS